MNNPKNVVYAVSFYDNDGNLVERYDTDAAEETKKQIINGLDAAIYLLQDMRSAAIDGMFVENRANVIRECRNIKDFSEVLKENWDKVALWERQKAVNA